jgi:uncharacterized protein YneF (UPF0154 family)
VTIPITVAIIGLVLGFFLHRRMKPRKKKLRDKSKEDN